jgi:hypothetical protein
MQLSVKRVAKQLDQSPAAVYLAQLAKSGGRTQHQALNHPGLPGHV